MTPRPLAPATTHVSLNRLRTLLAWCEDNAHALPDGYDAAASSHVHQLTWWADQPAVVVDRLAETFGPARTHPNGHIWTWVVPLGADYLWLNVYVAKESDR